MSGILSHIMAGGRLGPNLTFDNANAILARAEWNTVQVVLLADGSFSFVGTNVGGPTRWAAAVPNPGPGSEVRLVGVTKFGVGAVSLGFQFDGVTYTSGNTPWVDFDPSVGLVLSPSVVDTGGASFALEIRDKVTLQTISRGGSLEIIAPVEPGPNTLAYSNSSPPSATDVFTSTQIVFNTFGTIAYTGDPGTSPDRWTPESSDSGYGSQVVVALRDIVVTGALQMTFGDEPPYFPGSYPGSTPEYGLNLTPVTITMEAASAQVGEATFTIRLRDTVSGQILDRAGSISVTA